MRAKRGKVLSVLLCLLLAVTSAFGLLFRPMTTVGSAISTNGTSLRFKQVAAGEGFAIALSYDNTLYGWSLTRSNVTTFDTTASSLAGYYPSYPTEISVDLLPNEYIAYIAATATAAAFVTDNSGTRSTDNCGRVFTWGYEVASDSLTFMSLLLHTPTKEPALIDSSRSVYLAEASGYTKVPKSLYAGEDTFYYNYEQNSSARSSAWGSNGFDQRSSAGVTGDKVYPNTDVTIIGGGDTAAFVSGSNVYVKGKNYYLPSAESGLTVKVGTITKANDNSNVPGGISDWGKGNSGDQQYPASFDIIELPRMFDIAQATESTVSAGDISVNYHLKGNSLLTMAGKDYKYYINEGIVHFDPTTSGASANTALYSGNFGQVNGWNTTLSDLKQSETVQMYSGLGAMTDSDTVKAESYRQKFVLGNGYGYIISGTTAYAFGNNAGGQYGDATAETKAAGGTSLAPILSGAGDVYAVAAGLTRRVAVGTATLNGTTITGYGANSNEFISGAVTVSGLYAWSNTISAKNIIGEFAKYGVTATGNHTISTIFGAYNKNMFALSNLGKLFRITESNNDFSVYMYDEFRDKDNNVISNYTSNSAATAVSFSTSNALLNSDPNKVVYEDAVREGQIAVQGARLTLSTLENSNAEVTDSYFRAISGGYASPIATNNAGDAFRILLGSDDVARNDAFSGYADNTYTAHDGVALPILPTSNGGNRLVRFYKIDTTHPAPAADNELLPGGELDWYLKYKFEKLDSPDAYGNNIAIVIEPYRRTNGFTIRMQYIVGRYDSTTKANVSATEKAFYGFSTVSVNISIDNTDAVGGQISALRSSGEYSGNSTVPLLDPNYTLNSTYSIAVNDISTGLENLARHLNGNNLSDDISGFWTTTVPGSSDTPKTRGVLLDEALLKADSGFPASAKASDVGMRYLFASDYLSEYYNGRYQFFVFDRDGDTIRVNTPSVQSSTYLNVPQVKTVTAYIPRAVLATSVSSVETERKLATFNNVYGFTATYLYDPDDTSRPEGSRTSAENPNTIRIEYSVITVSAKRSTNSAVYDNNALQKFSTAANVNGYSYNASFGFNEGSNTIIVDNNTVQYLPIFAQSSLQTVGAAGNSTVNTYLNQRMTVTQTVTVGSPNAQMEFSLANIPSLAGVGRFADTSNLYFVNEVVGSNAGAQVNYEGYADYASRFDETAAVVELNRNTVRFLPKKADTYRFTVVMRRDTRASSTAITGFADTVETSGSNETRSANEKIYVDFVITANNSAFVSGTDILKPSFDIKNDANITLAAARTVPVSELTDLRDVRVISVTSAKRNILSVSRATDGSSFTMTPVSSGQTKVIFVLAQYGLSYTVQFNVQVEGRSTLDKTLSIVERETVNLSSLRSVIADDNAATAGIDFTELVLDTFTAETVPAGQEYRMNGYYFIDASTGQVITANNGLPSFVSSVELARDARNIPTGFNLSVGNYNAANVPTALFVVCFVGSDTGGNQRRFEGAVYVEPTTRFLKDDTGADLVLKLDMKAAQGTGWTKDSQGNISIDLNYLTGLEGISSLPNINRCRIQMVTSSEEGSQYFTYSYTQNTVTIKPDLPVSEQMPLNVSISDAGTDTSYVLSFYVTVDGIRIVLEKGQYLTILLASMGGVLLLLVIIFVIRMSLYWKKQAEQRRIIKKNQMLIRMRDKMHNSSGTATREQIVKTKLKLEDPKYAKMFNAMRKDKEGESGITLDASDVASRVDARLSAGKASKKKKKNKKSINDLKAELEAKKAAVARMQAGEDVGMTPPTVEPMFEQGSFTAQSDFGQDGFAQDGFAQGGFEQGAFTPEFDATAQPMSDDTVTPVDTGEILFDVEQVDNDNQ